MIFASLHVVRKARRMLAWMLLCFIMVSLACSKPPYELATARGYVTLDGKPLGNAKVMFAPIAKGDSIKAGKPAFGLLQSDGQFTLGTYAQEDGAMIGEHWVTVIPLQENKGRDRPSQHEASTRKQSWSRVTFPERMSVVADKENEFTIALTTAMTAKYGQLVD